MPPASMSQEEGQRSLPPNRYRIHALAACLPRAWGQRRFHQRRFQRHAQAAPQTRAAYVDARVARLTALDANHDGVVSVEERRAGQAAHRASWIDARFAKMDANGDGMISRAEFDAAAAAQPQHGARMDRHGRPGAERQAGPIVISDVAAKLGQRFDAMDSNRDGVISPEERRADRAAHRAERPGRRAPRPAARSRGPAPGGPPGACGRRTRASARWRARRRRPSGSRSAT